MRDFILSAAPWVAVFWVSFGLGAWARPHLDKLWGRTKKGLEAAKAQE